MKLWNIAAILMIALIVGCAQESTPTEPVTQQPAAPPAQEPPAAPQEPAAPPAETEEAAPEETEEPMTEEEKEMMEPDQEQIDRLRTACENGAVNLCVALKTRYGIDAEPLSEETAEETTEETMEE